MPVADRFELARAQARLFLEASHGYLLEDRQDQRPPGPVLGILVRCVDLLRVVHQPGIHLLQPVGLLADMGEVGSCHGAALQQATRRAATHRPILCQTLGLDLESRLAAKEMLEAPRQQMQSLQDTVLRLRSELDLEPNATFQAAIDRWGDAATAYEQALERPMSSRWNPVRLYLGKTPQDEIDGLADDYKAGLEELRAAVREYKASLELPAQPERRLRLPAPPRPHVRRQDGATAKDRTGAGVTAETRDRTQGQQGQRQEQSEVVP